MRQQFPLFQTPLDLAHSFWKKVLQPGDLAIDATCGNGKDSLELASILSRQEGSILCCMDIQKQAIEATKILLKESLPDFFPNCHFYLSSHEQLPEWPAYPLKLVVYNLGYLPGSDKTITTQQDSTLASVQQALKTLADGGVLSVTCYPGHPAGAEEEHLLFTFFSDLPPKEWSFTFFQWANRHRSPSLMLVQKNQKWP